MSRNILVALEFQRAPLFAGIAKYAREHGWHLSLEMLPNPGRIPWGWDGDGILTMLVRDGTPLLDFLAQAGKPTVNVEGRRLGSPPYPRVLTDTSLAAEMALRHFRERGFRHFAFYGYAKSVRGEDFARVLRRAGFDCAVLHEGEGSWSDEKRRVGDWLAGLPRPLAVFCWNDYAGASFIDICRGLGHAVPEEIGVLAMDNEELVCDCTAIPLSSLRTELEEVGYQGAALLGRILDGEAPPRRDLLIPPSEVICRASSDMRASSSPLLRKALAYFEKHLAEPVNVAAALRHCQVSRRGLEQAFRRELDASPGEILLRLRLERACALLRDSDDKIAAVAAACGFVDAGHFATLFRRHRGASPRLYREQSRSPR
ncbi:MAG: hypothetical protein RL095_679 [Verrucomicrobiota bacterium]|jgi:LacI family transcriptional regulator